MDKRNYRANLDFVESAFRACWGNSLQLVAAAKVLLDATHHATACSLSVLSLEEVGKFFCIDGLLYAKADDHRAAAYAKSLKSHSIKLSALTFLPMLLGNLARSDPRYDSEPAFRESLLSVFIDLKKRGNKVFALLNRASFQELDVLKQVGFYAQPTGQTFSCPQESISQEIAEAVYLLAWRLVTTLDFLMKSGGLEHYIGRARQIRAKLSEPDHQALEQRGKEVFEALFPQISEQGEDELEPTPKKR
jgi:AbiV family abortive infection protein